MQLSSSQIETLIFIKNMRYAEGTDVLSSDFLILEWYACGWS